MTELMTPKERWLAAIRMQPVDRLPFWPKLDAAYFKAQPKPFRDMNVVRMHAWLGSDQHMPLADCVKEVRKTTSVETTERAGMQRTVYRTPQGETALVSKFDGPSHSWHPVEFPIRSLNDIRLMTRIFEDVTVEFDADGLKKAQSQSAQIGQSALTLVVIGESPLMHWVEWLAGIENAHLFLMDHREQVEQLFEAIHSVLKRKTEFFCEHSPADVFYLMENTSTTLISPDQYQRYCVRHIGEYAAITTAAGRNLVLHMCGHLKAVLPLLARLPVQAFEAFTSPTLGNTTLLDGRTQCPDKCLIGGTNAMLWTEPADRIIARIEKDLDELPHHRGIVVTSAGVMPQWCQPQTIKKVCEWVKKYSARMKEIRPRAAVAV